MRSDILVAVERMQKQNARSFAPIYIGYPGNTFMPYKVTKELTVLDLQTSVAFEELIERVPDLVFILLSARARRQTIYSNRSPRGTRQRHVARTSLIEWDVHDAIEYLGDDYPYLLNKGEQRRP